MDTSASPLELQEAVLDAISAGKNLHFGHFGKGHLAKIHFGNSVYQTNIAIQIGVAIGGSVLQIIGQSNISDFTI